MFSETVMFATVSSHLCVLSSYVQVQHNLPHWQPLSDFEDFSNGVCHVMKIAIAESNPDMGLLTQQTFCFSPDILARASKIPEVSMSRASDWGLGKFCT